MRARILIAALVALAFATLTAGCSLSSDPVPTADLVGTWRGGASTQLTLDESGTFTARDLPGSWDGSGASFTGAGRWTMVAAGNYQEQHLDLSSSAHGSGPLYVGRSRGKVILYFWIGDPDADKRFVFARS
jgi:hypothetical protein